MAKKKNGRKVTPMWCDTCRYPADHEFQGIGQGWICQGCNKHIGQAATNASKEFLTGIVGLPNKPNLDLRCGNGKS